MNLLNLDLPENRSPSLVLKARKREIFIDTTEELRLLLSRFTLTGRRTGVVILHFLWLSEAAKQKYSTELNHHYKACGCREGIVTGLMGLVVVLAEVFSKSIWWPEGNTIALAFLALCLVFCLMTIGKALGILRAKIKLLNTIHEIAKIEATKKHN